MNYRHAFHAGNFADLVKHAALLGLLDRLLADPRPLTVLDTHAGAGLYDLTDPAQARSREAQAGIARLMQGDAPPAFDALKRAVEAHNPGGGLRTYPGSPALVLDRLRPQDRLIACELRPDDADRLATLLAGRAEARLTDGFEAAPKVARAAQRLLVLIDPPFERPDDYARTADAVAEILEIRPEATVLVWLPLKDLETLDGFVRRLEAHPGLNALVAETRLRPLKNPMSMNGCVLVLAGDDAGFADDLLAISDFVARSLGDPGGEGRLWRAGG
jgi:23S rRNA (adenine2030-N6)-methyltransferase